MQKSKRIVSWWPASLVVAMVAVSASAQPLTNPSFDDVAGGSTNGWFTFGNVFISNAGNDNIFQSPDAAVKVFGDFSGGFNVAGLGQAFPATDGSLYEFDVFSLISSGDLMSAEANLCESNRALAKIAFFDAPAGGNEIAGNEVVIGDPNTTPDVWTQHTVSALAPPGTMRVEALILYLQPTGAGGGAIFVDDCDFRNVGPPVVTANLLSNGDFGDGTLSSWTTFENVFAESNSALVRTPPSSAALFGNFSGDFNVAGMFQEFPATQGSGWSMRLFSLRKCVFNGGIGADETLIGNGPPDDNWAVAKIAFLDSGGVEISGSEVIIASGQSPLGTWTPHSVGGVAPAGTASVQALVLFLQPGLDGGAVFVDDIVFEEVGAVPVTGAWSLAMMGGLLVVVATVVNGRRRGEVVA